jgi:beta-fructofuranosidase
MSNSVGSVSVASPLSTRYGYGLERGADEVDPIWTGRLWECPQLLRYGHRHILIFSVWDKQTDTQRLAIDVTSGTEHDHGGPAELHYPVVAVGTFDGRRFVPDNLQRFDHGANCYAPAAFSTPDGRILSWGWSWEGLVESARLAQGWAGCLTFPRELSIANDGTFAVVPARELVGLRGRGASIQGVSLAPDVSSVPGPIAATSAHTSASRRSVGI